MGFKKGHKGFRTKESYKTADKSHFTNPEYIEKQRQIALDKGYGKWMVGKKLSNETKKKLSEIRMGHKPTNWTDNPTYSTIHKWLVRVFGVPNICEHCFSEKKCEYALLHDRQYERVRENFITLCVSCHRKYDWRKRDKYKLVVYKQ